MYWPKHYQMIVPIQWYSPHSFLDGDVCLIITVVVVVFTDVCECTVGVDVGDGTTIVLKSIPPNVVMGCIVLGRQMYVCSL